MQAIAASVRKTGAAYLEAPVSGSKKPAEVRDKSGELNGSTATHLPAISCLPVHCMRACLCVCVCACVRVCMRVCVCVCVSMCF